MSRIHNEKPVTIAVSAIDEPQLNTNVLTINRPAATRQHSNTANGVLSTIQDCDSTRSMTPPHGAHNEKSPVEIDSSPYSYLERSESKQNINGSNSGFDTDIEALTHQKTEAGCSRSGLVAMKTKCSTANAWPSRVEQKNMIKANKQKKACCGCWAAMTRVQRNALKAGILLVLIGLIIGLCVGVTKAVNGGVFHPN